MYFCQCFLLFKIRSAFVGGAYKQQLKSEIVNNDAPPFPRRPLQTARRGRGRGPPRLQTARRGGSRGPPRPQTASKRASLPIQPGIDWDQLLLERSITLRQINVDMFLHGRPAN